MIGNAVVTNKTPAGNLYESEINERLYCDFVDAVDRKVLLALLEDARMSFTQVGKRAHISRENAQYRVNRLIENGTIVAFVPTINYGSLGLQHFVTYISGATKEEEESIAAHKNVSWAGPSAGKWDFVMDLYAADILELDRILTHLIPSHVGVNTLQVVEGHHWFGKLLGERTGSAQTWNSQQTSLDTIDKTLLRVLSSNARTSYTEMARHTGLTGNAIKHRIKRLESDGIITGYTITIDHAALGWQWYGVQLANIKVQRTLSRVLDAHPNVLFSYEFSRLGSHTMDVGVIASDAEEFRRILRELRNHADIHDVSIVVQQFTGHGIPEAIFTE